MSSTLTDNASAASDNCVRTAYADAERKEAFLPTTCVQNHAANLHTLDNGDLLCVWFGGTQEGIPDVSIYLSRLAAGTAEWSAAEKLSDDPTRSEQNPVLFSAPNGRLWLSARRSCPGIKTRAIVRRRVSTDDGQTWGPVETLFDTARAGIFVRQPLINAGQRLVVCRCFYCRTPARRKWVGNNDISAVMISDDQRRPGQRMPGPGQRRMRPHERAAARRLASGALPQPLGRFHLREPLDRWSELDRAAAHRTAEQQLLYPVHGARQRAPRAGVQRQQRRTARPSVAPLCTTTSRTKTAVSCGDPTARERARCVLGRASRAHDACHFGGRRTTWRRGAISKSATATA